MNTYLFASPKFRPLTDAGGIMPSAYMQFYLSDSATPTDVFTTADLDVPLANPVPANAAGLFPFIYMDPEVTYRVQLYNADDELIWDCDPYTPPRDYAPGTVLMFMGSAIQLEAAYPAVLWQVCDGTNNTYDLRGRIPIGVSASIDPGEAVGSEAGVATTTEAGEHDHDGATGSTVLVEANLPSHAHFCAVDIEGSDATLVSSTLGMQRASSSGGDTEYRLRGSATARTVSPSSSTGSGTGHTHTIIEDGTHDHDVQIPLPPARGIWFVMRRFP